MLRVILPFIINYRQLDLEEINRRRDVKVTKSQDEYRFCLTYEGKRILVIGKEDRNEIFLEGSGKIGVERGRRCLNKLFKILRESNFILPSYYDYKIEEISGEEFYGKP